MKDLISIIIPVYNVEPYLRKCVNSILQQTYKNLEVFLVDDGSPDRCPQICDEFANSDSRIIVLHKNNGGQGTARNMALNIANGEYICFLDSDDSVRNDYVEFLYNLLLEQDLDISVCNYELFSESGKFLRKRREGSGYVELSGIESIESLWTQGIINIGPWGKLYKCELWRNVRFKECYSEDWATMHYIYEKASRVGYSYECKLNYLVRGNSDIRSFQEKKLIMLDIANDNIKFCNKYPNLLSAAEQKAISVYFHLLFQLPDEKVYRKYKSNIKDKICEIRWDVLNDHNCIKKTKIALLTSYLGFGFTKKIFLIMKKKDITF